MVYSSGSTYTIFIYMTDRSNWVKVLRKCDRKQQETARSSCGSLIIVLASLSKLYLWPLPTIPVDIHGVCYGYCECV